MASAFGGLTMMKRNSGEFPTKSKKNAFMSKTVKKNKIIKKFYFSLGIYVI